MMVMMMNQVTERLIQRSDDNEETMKKRLEQFHTNVKAFSPLFTDVTFKVDGKGTPLAVFEAIDLKLNKL